MISQDFDLEMFEILSKTQKNKPLEIFIPNDLFKILNELGLSGKQKAFAFALYVFVKVTDVKGYRYKISDIKELWGYSPNNKSLNDLVKRNGILDKAGITRTVIDGIDILDKELLNEKSTKIQYKEIAYDVDIKKGGFFKIYSEMMLGCILKNKEIGVVGFLIYCFICYKCQMKGLSNGTIKGVYEWEHISPQYIEDCLGISKSTAKKYLKVLLDYGFLKKKSNFIKYDPNRVYSKYDANQFYPSVECPKELLPKDKHIKTKAKIIEYRGHNKEDYLAMIAYMDQKRLERQAKR